MPFDPPDYNPAGAAASGGTVAFWGHGQTRATGEVIAAVESGRLSDNARFHRFRFNSEFPDEVYSGTVPGVRTVDASEASSATLIDGSNSLSGNSETAILDRQVVYFPTGKYRLHLRSVWQEQNSINSGIWCYRIEDEADSFVTWTGTVTGTTSTPDQDPLQSYPDGYEMLTSVDQIFILDSGDDGTMLTFLYGGTTSVAALIHNYVLYVEALP